MNKAGEQKRNVTTAKATEIMRKNGVEISEKKAEEVLAIMYFLAKFIVNQEVKK